MFGRCKQACNLGGTARPSCPSWWPARTSSTSRAAAAWDDGRAISATGRGLERLALPQFRSPLHDGRHAIEAVQHLRVHRRAHPQRAVGVEGGDACLRRYVGAHRRWSTVACTKPVICLFGHPIVPHATSGSTVATMPLLRSTVRADNSGSAAAPVRSERRQYAKPTRGQFHRRDRPTGGDEASKGVAPTQRRPPASTLPDAQAHGYRRHPETARGQARTRRRAVSCRRTARNGAGEEHPTQRCAGATSQRRPRCGAGWWRAPAELCGRHDWCASIIAKQRAPG